MTYKVTNQRLFDSKLSDVNLTTLRGGRDIRGREGITGDPKTTPAASTPQTLKMSMALSLLSLITSNLTPIS